MRKSEPTIVDGALSKVSPSQIKTFRACARQWYYEKVMKLPRKPEGAGARLGTKSHSELEEYLKTGNDRRSSITMAGDHLIQPYMWAAPVNGGPGIVEGSLTNPTIQIGDITMVGYYDFLVPGDVPTIIDHKFKKDLTQYGATAGELESDEQAVIYGEWARRAFNAPMVKFVIHEHQTQGRVYAQAVSVVLKQDHLFHAFNAIEDTVRYMRVTAQVTDPVFVPPNELACTKYGGCSFAAQCPNSPMNRKGVSMLFQGKEEKKVNQEPEPETVMYTTDEVSPPDAPLETPVAKKPRATKVKKEEATPLQASPSLELMKHFLMVDVLINKPFATDLMPLIAAQAKAIADLEGIPDVRLATKNSTLAYGGWKAVLGNAIAESLAPGMYSVQSSELSEPVIEALCGKEGVYVVRGRK